MMRVIYKITNPKGRVYIGQTSNIAKRVSSYRRCTCYGQTLLFNSIKKYGWDKHEFKIVHELPQDVDQSIVNTYEILYIEQYQSHAFKYPKNGGLNLTDGGGGTLGKVFTDKDRERVSRILTGKKRKPFTDEHRKNISETHKNIKQSKETIEKRISKTKGLKRTQEFIDQARERLLGKKMSAEHILNSKIARTGIKQKERSKAHCDIISKNKKEFWRKKKCLQELPFK
jgi:group I intron endonuclease